MHDGELQRNPPSRLFQEASSADAEVSYAADWSHIQMDDLRVRHIPVLCASSRVQGADEVVPPAQHDRLFGLHFLLSFRLLLLLACNIPFTPFSASDCSCCWPARLLSPSPQLQIAPASGRVQQLQCITQPTS